MQQSSILLPALVLAGTLSGVSADTACAGDGAVSTLAEIPGGTGGLVADHRGNVYSAEFGDILGDGKTAGTRLFRIAPNGESSVFASGFQGASGVAIGPDGNFYQANIRGGFISRVTSDGAVTTFAQEGIRGPVGIVIDEQGTLWVANCGGGSIQKITSDGTSSLFFKSPALQCPNGMARDADGNLYTANFYNGDVVQITPKGEASILATLPKANNGHLVHADDALYVVARSAHQIYRVGLDGTVTLFAGTGEKGGNDGPRLEASFCYPNDIAVSVDGKHFYVNEVADHSSEGKKLEPTRIRVIDR